MIEVIERLRRNMETAASDMARNHFAKQHQAAIKEWRAHNTLKAVTE